MRYILTNIQNIIAAYDGKLPLAHFLKEHFRKNPKLGSRDRKIISEMAYCWYRCEKAISGVTSEDKIGMCLFLCCTENKHAISFIAANLQTYVHASLQEKIALLSGKGIDVNIPKIFGYDIALSKGIEKENWLLSTLQQPNLFIRIRKQETLIFETLKQHGIPFKTMGKNCLSLPNGAAIDKILPADSYVVQDLSSQATGNYFHAKKNETWYDCCAGAGGKSLLLKDSSPEISLTVSDKRESILHNLKERFKLYKLNEPSSIVTDVANHQQLLNKLDDTRFDNIICDAPCSGSGTWARTPEQLYFFEEQHLAAFPTLQKKIATNVSGLLKPGGRLIYITCSVFQQENEEVVNEVLSEKGLELETMQLINGISDKADSMFIAVMRKS